MTFSLLIIILICSCQSQVKTQSNTYCLGDIKYKIAQTANPDHVLCTIDVPDSSLFYHLISKEDRLRIDFFGTLYNIDSFKVISHSLGANNIDYTIVIDQTTTSLMKYEKHYLDSIIQMTRENLRIEITDTLTHQKWKFNKCNQIIKNDKGWFHNVPRWLFFND